MSSPLIFIDGDQGTTGLLIHERLKNRGDLTLLTLPDGDRKDPQRRAEALNQCDIAILCLPDEAAREAVAAIHNPRVRLIDASSAHRTAPGWVYGFPEMAPGQGERIARATRVSNPGCYPTGAIGLLRPLVTAGLLPASHAIAIHAVSGYSGAGRAGVARYEGPERGSAPPFEVYGLALQHKHVPEICAQAGLTTRPLFLPAYGAYRQGIVLTIPLHLHALAPVGGAAITAPRLRQALAHHYEAAPGVEVLSQEATQALTGLDPEALNGTNQLRLGVLESPDPGQAVLFALFDNLGKGASGAAVQNLGLMLGD